MTHLRLLMMDERVLLVFTPHLIAFSSIMWHFFSMSTWKINITRVCIFYFLKKTEFNII